MAPTITLHIDEARYSSVWLKYVRGVDLTEHCLNCLVGDRCSEIHKHPGVQTIVLDEHELPAAFYLCGVTRPYVWEANAHLAFVPAAGESWSGTPFLSPGATGMRVHLDDAAPFFGFSEASIPEEDPNRGDRLYRTCRNYQFAHEAAARLGWSSQRNPAKFRKRTAAPRG